MGKNEKTSLGRALVKHHNHMIQETKEKGKSYKDQHKKVLESVTEVSDIDAIIEQAEEAERLFAIHHDSATPVPINMSVSRFIKIWFLEICLWLLLCIESFCM